MRKSKLILAFASAFLISWGLFAQNQDEKIFHEVMSGPKDITSIALHLLNTPYVAGTLEQIPEELTINMHETDCILFVEMCTALAYNAKIYPNPTFSQYCNRIRSMRYRDGVVNGYDSRLHYTSEWILQNEKKGILEEITSKYGTRFDQKFSFMSTHPSSYKQLKDSDDMVRRIASVENRLNQSGPFYYISQERLREIEKEIHNGDIICFISPVEGLDISHVALAYWNEKDELHFIHASMKEKKVVIEKKTLADYAKNGIRLLRLK